MNNKKQKLIYKNDYTFEIDLIFLRSLKPNLSLNCFLNPHFPLLLNLFYSVDSLCLTYSL